MRGQDAVDGAGVRLRRVLGASNIQAFAPFLMLDGFDSADPGDYIKGFPWHPHRGIETITYLGKSRLEHGDSLGNRGARFVLLAAKPLHEQVAWGGPIVMNSREELELAFDELDKGTLIKHKV